MTDDNSSARPHPRLRRDFPQSGEELLLFPFGHAYGMPHDRVMQRRVLELALRVLAGAATFGTRVDLDIEWPLPLREAYRAWQPKEASPIVRKMLEARGS